MCPQIYGVDSSLLEYHFAGKSPRSSLPIYRLSGISPSIDTISAGRSLLQVHKEFQLRLKPTTIRHTLLDGWLGHYTHHMTDRHMARAIELAIENVRSGLGGPFGAVVVKEGKIIAEGANSVTSTNDPTAHAEVVAIRRACARLEKFELRDCEIYSSCEPCPMCLGAIYWARPVRVYFAATAADAASAGFDDSLISSEIAQPPASRKIPMIQLASENAAEPFRAWKLNPNKVQY
jgi:guanine deaminase